MNLTRQMINEFIDEITERELTNLDVLITLFPDITILKLNNNIILDTKTKDWCNKTYIKR